jgi:23S rRNA G2445 N2-methylase RlmL
MKGLAITSKGIEDITSLEIKDLIKSKGEIKDSCVIFNIKKLEDLCLLCYRSQSVDKIMLLLDNFDFKDNKDLVKKLKSKLNKIKLSDWLDKETTFRVSCKLLKSQISKGLENSKNFQKRLNNEENIKKTKKYKQKVDLDTPDITFLLFINQNTAYLGIDFSGRDLHKREYKVFTHPDALRSTIAYSLLRIADLKPKELLLDPFCHSGEIPIESALSSTNFPVNYYAKEKFAFLRFKPLKKLDFNKFFEKIDKKITKIQKATINCFDPESTNLNAAKKNAKIAGIKKSLNFSRMETTNLDIKLEKEIIDQIVTHPPEQTKSTNPTDLGEIYDEFFYQSKFILKKQGKLVTISRKTDLLKQSAEKHKFKIKQEREVWSGKQVMNVITFSK